MNCESWKEQQRRPKSSEELGNVHSTSFNGKTSFGISVILNMKHVCPNGIIYMVLNRLLGYMVAKWDLATHAYNVLSSKQYRKIIQKIKVLC